MPSKIKTTLIAGAVALAATLGAVEAAEAGGRHYVPLGPFNTYLADSYDDDDSYGCDDCGHRYGDAEDAVAATAARAARRYLGVDVDNMLDE